jgi:hypothetical protein
MRAALAAILAAGLGCGAPRGAAPVGNSDTPRRVADPLAELAAIRAGLCNCVEHPGPSIEEGDDSCIGPFANRYNAWSKNPTSRAGLSTADQARLAELDDAARRCFQAAIGDPLPPKRD